MPAYNKFNNFSEQLSKGVHQIGTHTFKLFLSNTAPSASNTILSDITQISYANLGGSAPTITLAESETEGVTTVTAVSVAITATATSPTFQYYGIYNDSATSPLKALVCWFDHGSPVTLDTTNSPFNIKFNNSNVGSPGALFTLA